MTESLSRNRVEPSNGAVSMVRTMLPKTEAEGLGGGRTAAQGGRTGSLPPLAAAPRRAGVSL